MVHWPGIGKKIPFRWLYKKQNVCKTEALLKSSSKEYSLAKKVDSQKLWSILNFMVEVVGSLFQWLILIWNCPVFCCSSTDVFHFFLLQIVNLHLVWYSIKIRQCLTQMTQFWKSSDSTTAFFRPNLCICTWKFDSVLFSDYLNAIQWILNEKMNITHWTNHFQFTKVNVGIVSFVEFYKKQIWNVSNVSKMFTSVDRTVVVSSKANSVIITLIIVICFIFNIFLGVFCFFLSLSHLHNDRCVCK